MRIYYFEFSCQDPLMTWCFGSFQFSVEEKQFLQSMQFMIGI